MPAVNCDKCDSDLTGCKPVKCADCSVQVHSACAGNVKRGKPWKCEACVGETASSHSDSAVDVKKNIAHLLQTMKTEIIEEFRTEIRALTEECRKNNARIDAVEAEQTVMKTRCEVLERVNEDLKTEVRDLRRQARDADQHSRAANLEIQGVPATPNENLILVLERIAGALQVPFSPEMISIVHRLRLFSRKHTEPPIIAQFVSRSVREKWLVAARKVKHLKATDIDASLHQGPVYVNEHLTVHNKTLLGRARSLYRAQKLCFATYVNGKVLVKRKPEDQATRVFEGSDLDQFDR